MEAIGAYLHHSPLLVVLSGPSGAGKDAVIARMKEMGRPYFFGVTATTRAKRANEIDGVHYTFISKDRFESMLVTGEFIEHAHVYGNFYGVPKHQIRQALANGEDVLLKIDVQGAATIKSLVPQAVFIFLAAPNLNELEKRLRSRNSESVTDIELRLKTAEKEMLQLPIFNYVVINEDDQIDKCVSEIDAIISAEKCRIPRRIIELP